ncbi:DMT family transporter [Nocardiopsis algeriensis]|uniref:DME family drug/metabolite transporter n=1 Tax=Nocardiopsis algeriensis TaxID=1478215 RepID=A0A841IVR5_9ACTN|nr:DME family drug/metabolite transporter [Nocardiopsis algeriensis]
MDTDRTGTRPRTIARGPVGAAPRRLAGIGAITVTSVLWGTTGTAATFAPEAGPLAIGSAALGIGGLLQALIALPALRSARARLRENLALVVAGAVAVGVYPLAFYGSMHLAGVAVGTVVSLASAPLASGLLELVVQRRPLGRWWTAAALLGAIGSALLCLSAAEGPSASPGRTAAGITLGLVAGATYALFSWAAHGLMGRGIDRAASMGAVFGAGGVLLMPVLAVTGAPLLASAQSFAVAAYMALVPMFLGYLLFGLGLARVPASTATTVTLLEPAVAAVLAVLVVGETLGGAGLLGLGAVALALAVLVLAPAGGGGAAPPRPGAART